MRSMKRTMSIAREDWEESESGAESPRSECVHHAATTGIAETSEPEPTAVPLPLFSVEHSRDMQDIVEESDEETVVSDDDMNELHDEDIISAKEAEEADEEISEPEEVSDEKRLDLNTRVVDAELTSEVRNASRAETSAAKSSVSEKRRSRRKAAKKKEKLFSPTGDFAADFSALQATPKKSEEEAATLTSSNSLPVPPGFGTGPEDVSQEQQIQPRGKDSVYFTMFGPETAPEEFTISVWAYLLKDFAIVLAMQPKKNVKLGSHGPLKVFRDSEITVAIQPSEFFEILGPEKESFIWKEDPQSCNFDLKLVKDRPKVDSMRVVAHITLEGTDSIVGRLSGIVDLKNPRRDSAVTLPDGFPQEILERMLEIDNVDLRQEFLLIPKPHVFISYRRTHIDVAREVQVELETYDYPVFLDQSSKHGLKGGRFDEQLVKGIQRSPVVLVLLTKAPSTDKPPFDAMSSVQTMKYNHENGKTDWCLVEVEEALKDPQKLVIPVAAPGVKWEEEWKHLPEPISSLSMYNGIAIPQNGFDKAAIQLHDFIQNHLIQVQKKMKF